MGYLFIFFLRDGIHSRRAVWILVMGMIPVAAALVLLLSSRIFENSDLNLRLIYPQFTYLMFLHFLLPLAAVFTGTAVIGDEVEERTLQYLITRPVPRWSIVAFKALAGVVTVGAVILVSFALTYIIMTAGSGQARLARGIPSFLRSCGAMILGLAVYMPLFGFIGGVLKKPVFAGLLFVFGWESAVAWFPGNARFLTVAHYLHSLFPETIRIDPDSIGNSFFGIAISANRTPATISIAVLLTMAALFTALMTVLLYRKEYRLEQDS